MKEQEKPIITGDIRRVHNSEEKLPDRTPEYLKDKSDKARIVYRILHDSLASERVHRLLSNFHDLFKVSSAIIDLDGNVLSASKWQRICTDFHRKNSGTCARCIESDTDLANNVDEGAGFAIYHCKNGLVDCAAPINVDGEHIANLFIGQFLLEEPDKDFFKKQSEQFGFKTASYLSALDEVTVIDKEKAPQITTFLTELAQIIATMGLDQYRLSEREKKNKEKLEALVEERTKELSVANKEISLKERVAMTLLSGDNETVYADILDMILELTESPIGYFGYINSEGDLVCPSMTREIWDRCQMPDKTIVFPKNIWGGLWGRSLFEKKVMVSNDNLIAPQVHVPLNKAIAVPIMSDTELIGQIVVANKETEYLDADIKNLKTIADYIAPILKVRLSEAKEHKERLEAEKKLHKNIEVLNQAQMIGHIGHWSLDHVTSHISWSDELYRIFGFEPQEFAASTEAFLERIHPDEKDMVKQAYSKSIEKKKTSRLTHRIIRADDSVRYIDKIWTHTTDDQGNIINTLGTLHDITEETLVKLELAELNRNLQKQVELEIAKRQKHEQLMIQQSKMASMGEMLGAISHQLKQPLNAISL